jgi:thiosulfate dehydrogenase
MRAICLMIVALLGACQGTITARERGHDLMTDVEASNGRANVFECADCHQVAPDWETDRIFPGYSLVDSAYRESFWGGYERTLLDAMGFCRLVFMRGTPFDENDEDARAILEYLLSLSETDPAPALPLTVTLNIDADRIPRGDPTEGGALYDRACKHCHGVPGGHTPDRFRGDAVDMPGDEAGWAKLYDDPDFAGIPYGLIVIEKVRHGRFFGISGIMPLFSTEALSDEELGAILAYLEI